MRDVTDGQEQVKVEGETLGTVIAALDRDYPGIAERLCDGDKIRPSIQVSVDGRLAQRGLAEPVHEDSEVQFIPAISGG
jgi:molybdopterin synthase sulfur carrier subunit